MNLFAALTMALLSHGIRANAQGLEGEYPYIIKYVADDKCLAFDIRRHGFSGQGICGLTTSPGDFIANKQAVWRLQPLGGDQYLLKNAVYPDKCLIMSDNGHAQHPQFYNWGNGPDFCGFPGGKDALIANKQAVWHLEHFRDDMYLIKNDSNRPGECLWFGNNGADEYPSRFLGHAQNQLCGREGAYGNPTWMIQKVPPAAEHTIAICEGSEPVAMAVNESSNVVYVRCTRPGGAGLEDRVEAIDAAALDSVGRKTYPVTQVVSLPTHADGIDYGMAFNDITHTLYAPVDTGHGQLITLLMNGSRLDRRSVIDLQEVRRPESIAVSPGSGLILVLANCAPDRVSRHCRGYYVSSSESDVGKLLFGAEIALLESDTASDRIFLAVATQMEMRILACRNDRLNSDEACRQAGNTNRFDVTSFATVDPSTSSFVTISSGNQLISTDGRTVKTQPIAGDSDKLRGLVAGFGKLYALRQDRTPDGLSWLRAIDETSGAVAGNWWLGDAGPLPPPHIIDRGRLSMNRRTNKAYAFVRNQLIEMDLNAPR